MAVVAGKLVEWNPGESGHSVDLTYATRRTESIQAAHAILKHAEGLQPNDATIQSNLACYEAQMGNLDMAKAHLTCDTRIDKKFSMLAVDNPHCGPL